MMAANAPSRKGASWSNQYDCPNIGELVLEWEREWELEWKLEPELEPERSPEREEPELERKWVVPGRE